jgi:hypothetical protein
LKKKSKGVRVIFFYLFFFGFIWWSHLWTFFFFFLPIVVLAYLSNQRWWAWPHLSFCHIKSIQSTIGCLPKPTLISHMQSLVITTILPLLFVMIWFSQSFHMAYWCIDSHLPSSLPPSPKTNHNPTWLVQRY